jgi:hypothetical protein
MNIGMLWFDNDPKIALEAKLARAIQYYQTKYGANPNLCFVHPSMLENGAAAPTTEPRRAGIEVRPSRSVLPHHFWLGVNARNGQAGT